jgi:hypothetical protein
MSKPQSTQATRREAMTRRPRQGGESQQALSVIIAVAFFGFIIAVGIASPHYLVAPPTDAVLVGP